MRTPVVERAFQLADSGKHATFSALLEALVAEGYSDITVRTHLDGATIRKNLGERLKAAAG